MKYPSLGILCLLLRAIANAVEEQNSKDWDGNLPVTPAPTPPPSAEPPPVVTGEPTTDKPKRTRRTAAQIEADVKAAEEAAKGQPPQPPAEEEHGTLVLDTKEEPAAPIEGAMTYEELQALIQPFIKVPVGHQPRGLEVKAIIRKYTPDHDGGLKQLSTLPQHHKAFAADIEGLSY